jgi:threonyl-tRNA synthetase
LFAAAIKAIYPDAKLAIGPAISDGFYYDVDYGDVSLSEDSFSRIEQKMHEIVKKWTGFEKRDISYEDAKAFYKDNPYKLELIEEFNKNGEKLTFYKSGDFEDLCQGNHVENPRENLKHFKLLSVAGAYWRGSEKNKMLTRVYGTVFPSKLELDDHLKRLEEAKKRDHRKLGRDLDLFVFSDLVGKGLPLWTSKGATIKRVLERFIVDEELSRDYEHVSTPPIAKVDLYRTSGHYPYYKETMYPPMVVDDEELILRPMTCPHHFALFKSRPHSYHEMPVRYAEISPQFRYEKSGELTGLIRVRTFLLTDAHIITPVNQAKKEILGVLDLIDYVNKALGLKAGVDYRYRLSLGDRKEDKKYYKDDAAWENAENVLRDVLKNQEVPYFEAENEAAFYGPKIDVQMKNVNGKEDTAFTVQYDFVMPKRFELRFINDKGQEEEPVVIHRASLGAFERTIAFLIEHYGGALPLWLSPVQVAVLPLSDKFLEYAAKIKKELSKNKIRVAVNSQNKTLGAKIRETTLQKVPYMVIIGEKEQKDSVISIRTREGKDLGQKSVTEFINQLKSQIENFS